MDVSDEQRRAKLPRLAKNCMNEITLQNMDNTGEFHILSSSNENSNIDADGDTNADHSSDSQDEEDDIYQLLRVVPPIR